ncbi:MAG: hypothetical protein R3E32_01930 [Chitinophagales bacterium]
MKKFSILLMVCIVAFMSACQSEGNEQKEETVENKTEKTDEDTDLSGNTKEELEKFKKIVPTSKEVTDIQERYENYKKAILASSGKDAIENIDKYSIDYYGKVLDWALNSSKSEVEKLTPVDQFMVLSVRKRIPHGEVKKMTGRDLLIYTVDHEWTNKTTVQMTNLGEIRKEGENGARASMGVNKANTNTFIEFTREDKTADWKINLVSLSENVNEQLIRMASDRKQTESKLIFDMIKQFTESDVSDDVWNPIN